MHSAHKDIRQRRAAERETVLSGPPSTRLTISTSLILLVMSRIFIAIQKLLQADVDGAGNSISQVYAELIGSGRQCVKRELPGIV